MRKSRSIIIHPLREMSYILHSLLVRRASHLLVFREQRGDGEGPPFDGAGGALGRVDRRETLTVVGGRTEWPAENRGGRLGALRATARRRRKVGSARGELLATPGIFERRRGYVGAVALSNHGPEMNSVGVVDAIQALHVDDLPFLGRTHVFGDQPK